MLASTHKLMTYCDVNGKRIPIFITVKGTVYAVTIFLKVDITTIFFKNDYDHGNLQMCMNAKQG